MLILSLLWLLVGILVGLLANAARLQPASWGRQRWLVIPGIGALSALIGGWLCVLLLGRYIATPMALWIAVFGVVLVPWLRYGWAYALTRRRSHQESKSTSPTTMTSGDPSPSQ